ncbi:flippase [Thermococcus sp.]
MAETTRELGRAARGGAIALVGMFVSAVFGFLTRAVVGRVYGPSDYGAYNVAFTIFSLTMTLVLLGFPMGLQRQVSYFREREPEKTGELISTALITVFISSIIGMAFIELGKGWMAGIFLRDGTSRETLMDILTIIALAVPFSALLSSMISTTQGFKRVREYFLYGRVYQPLVYFVLISIIALIFKLPVKYTAAGYLITVLAVLVLFARDAINAGILPRKITFRPELAKLLLSFSIPLMLSGIVGFIMTWTDTLMLGRFRGSASAGIYNAAAPLARFIPVFLAAFTVIYSPIATGFYAEGKLRELNEFYTSITKWVLLSTFPLFLLLVILPGWVISILFGGKYIAASVPLVILAIGYLFHTVVGPNGLTLVSTGKPGQEMLGNIIGATLNVAINLLLIPKYGMVGAATATALSYIAANTYKSTVLWRMGIKPFNGRYLRVICLGAVLTAIGFMLPGSIPLRLAYVIGGTAAFYVGSLLLRAMDENDVEVIRMASRKFNLKADRLIKLIEKYS